MLKNYLNAALRIFLKQRFYTLLNITGLSVGIASAILIFLYVEYETRYDKFLPTSESLFKLHTERTYPNRKITAAITHIPMAETLVKEFAEVQQATRLSDFGTPVLVSVENNSSDRSTFEERSFFYADSNFFQVLPFRLLQGNAETALKFSGNVVLTENTAKRYFGEDEAIGKKIQIDTAEFIVTGVMQNVPENSHFKFDLLGASQTLPYWRTFNFRTLDVHTYAQLHVDADVESLNNKLSIIADKYVGPQVEESLGVSWAEYKKAGNGYRYFFMPLGDIHLNPIAVEYKQKPGTSITYIYILISIAVLIISIACINFINMSLARSSERAKEVAVRKSIGSGKEQLMAQFLTESVLLCVFSFVLAIGIVYISLPFFNDLVSRKLTLDISDSLVLRYSIFVTLLIGLLAGLYPSLVLSSFKPAETLKGNFQTSAKGPVLRSTLVVAQFIISAILITSVITVYNQLEYVQSKSLGFDKDHQVVIPYINRVSERANELAERMRLEDGVEDVSQSFSVPGINFFALPFTPEGSSEAVTSRFNSVDDHYFKTMRLDLAAGRAFGEEYNDSLAVILNEAAVSATGLSDPIGKRIQFSYFGPFGTSEPQLIPLEIVGVVKDFNFNSLHERVTPLLLLSNEGVFSSMNFITAKIECNKTTQAIENLNKVWSQLSPGESMQFSFLDKNLDELYGSERTSERLLFVFAGLAIVLSCFGLLGLIAYTANMRKKEIGIRKVLGASVMQVTTLLYKEYAKLIGIALVIATPIAWYLMEQWLGRFAYKINMTAGIVATAAFTTLIIAGLSVSYQALRAALTNPVKTLKNE